MRTLTIITGASRGLGFELARQSLKKGDCVVTMERKPNSELVNLAKEIDCEFVQFSADLLDRKGAVELLSWWLSGEEYKDFERVNLINNAGVLGPVGPIEYQTPQAAVDCIRINFEIPVLLTQAFLADTKDWKADRRVLNISSGAARKSVPGWAMYCSTKAALDRFTAVTAEDQARLVNGAKLTSTAPGVVDTDMQARIRESSPDAFPGVDRFKKLKSEGGLVSAEETARKLLEYLNSSDFGKEPITDIRIINGGKSV